NCQRLFVAAVLLLAASGALYRPRTVYAYPAFFDVFQARYPAAAGSKLTQAPPSTDCALTCHRTGYGNEHQLSRYGHDFRKHLQEHPELTIDQTFAALEALDSDGDGTSNVKEIKVSQTFPGDPNDRPLSASTVGNAARVESDAPETTPADDVSVLITA